MKDFEFTVFITPVGKARPRFANGHVYTPKSTRVYENLIRDAYIRAGGETFPEDVPLKVIVRAYFPIPKSTPKGRRLEMINDRIRHTHKPDTDNVLKAVLDALNGVAYTDDRMIVSVAAHKYYADVPCVEIRIAEVEGGT